MQVQFIEFYWYFYIIGFYMVYSVHIFGTFKALWNSICCMMLYNTFYNPCNFQYKIILRYCLLAYRIQPLSNIDVVESSHQTFMGTLLHTCTCCSWSCGYFLSETCSFSNCLFVKDKLFWKWPSHWIDYESNLFQRAEQRTLYSITTMTLICILIGALSGVFAT